MTDNPNLNQRQFGSRKVRAGLYVTTDGKHVIEKMDGDPDYGGGVEWRVHTHEGGGKSGFGGAGEWHGTHYTKADALRAASQCKDCG